MLVIIKRVLLLLFLILLFLFKLCTLFMRIFVMMQHVVFVWI